MVRPVHLILAGGAAIGLLALVDTGAVSWQAPGTQPASLPVLSFAECSIAINEARLHELKMQDYRLALAAWQRGTAPTDARPRVLTPEQVRQAQEEQRRIDSGIGRPSAPEYPNLRLRCSERDFRHMAERACDGSPVRREVCIDAELRQLERLVR